jgi:hypothetical protein
MKNMFQLAGIARLVMFQSLTAATPDAGPVLTEATDLTGAVMFSESHAPGMILVAIHGDHQTARLSWVLVKRAPATSSSRTVTACSD